MFGVDPPGVAVYNLRQLKSVDVVHLFQPLWN